ncbi:hypothetical protein E4U43_007328 [Claviceps pusilla]|uniref:Calcineurin-like phosphoesterase domain-containing protein n=1 Tax=Claviceps pusilla TaxID=123648 RepID=A0A9P7SZ71_9HYPO|nr:hypothetical protein E4U43_007328 [Claviceps pusilla]
MANSPTTSIKTRFIVLSDTHGSPIPPSLQGRQADVVIHTGDLTEHSTLSEFKTTIESLRTIDAPVKLILAGNHDFSLDSPALESKLAEADRVAGGPVDRDLVAREFGNAGDARALLLEARHRGITFLEEGNSSIRLDNGALLRVYASPYTPCHDGSAGWAFQYQDRHDFDIDPATQIVMTHGPPHGIFDRSPDGKRLGCPALFAAVARQQPLMHCFGHVHGGWGAKVVAWKAPASDSPSHFTDIDHEQSVLIGSLARARGDPGAELGSGVRETSHCGGEDEVVGQGKTLFVNASITGDEGSQLPWVVDLMVPSS